MNYIPTAQPSGSSSAVVVPDLPLIHTVQFLPVDADSKLTAEKADAQAESILDQMNAALEQAGSDLKSVVKLNFYVTSGELSTVVDAALKGRFSGTHKPAVSVVVTQLPVEGALVAVDGIAVPKVHQQHAAVKVTPGCSTMPAGARIYVSGQAEQSESLAVATRRTMESLAASLKFMGRSTDDIVQLKAFVMPISEAEIVRQELAAFFPNRPHPPVVLVEWKSSATTPIEIELIAWGGPARAEEPVLEYLTPPGMTQSPIYSRVCRINHGGSIFVSGLYAEPAASLDEIETPSAGEREVRQIFAELQKLLAASGSDLKHLVKATYYVSSNAASTKLNELRPGYYDPQRPPAASKAVVTSVGRTGLGLTIDMIAVPVPRLK